MLTAKEVLAQYKESGTVYATASKCGISIQTAMRVLAEYGIYPTERARQIADDLKAGMTLEDIAAKYNVGIKYIKNLLPYRRGSYVVGMKSKNAENIARWRESRAKEGW